MLGRIDGKLDGLTKQMGDVARRTDAMEVRVGHVEDEARKANSRLDTLNPEVESLLVRATDLERWRTGVHASAKATTTIIRGVWAVCGMGFIAMLAWLVTSFVHSLPVEPAPRRVAVETRAVAAPPKP